MMAVTARLTSVWEAAARRWGNWRLLVVVGVLLAGCSGQPAVLDDRLSPQGRFRAVIVGDPGPDENRCIVVSRSGQPGTHCVVFRSMETWVAIRWEDERNLLVYYSEEGSEITALKTRWEIDGTEAGRVQIRLRPLRGAVQEHSIDLK